MAVSEPTRTLRPGDPPGRPAAVGPAQQALGAELRRLRVARLRPDGRRLTQAALAAALYVGGKPAVSLLESGKRLPDAKTLERYVEVAGGDADRLARLLAAATAERDALRNQVRDPDPDASRAKRDRDRRRPTRRLVLGIAAAAVLAAGAVTAAVVATHRGAAPGARFLEPVGSVALPSPLHGTVVGYADDDLWIDVQAVDEPRHHPMNRPCTRDGDVFACDPLYAGRPSDVGVTFRVSLLATARGGAADTALLAYGARDTSGPDAYAGLPTLPDGATVVASELVTRT